MKNQKCLSEKLQLLEPDEKVIFSYKEIETKSVDKLKEFLMNGNPKFYKTALQIIAKVNELRKTMRAQMSIRVQVFKDISVNKQEFKQYIRVSFPHITVLKEKNK